MLPRRAVVLALLAMLLSSRGALVSASPDAADYELVDPELRVVQIDTSAEESFLSLKTDAAGRLFVGGREAIFVYELDANGNYGPRQLLYRFPNHSWVYDVEIRGEDLYALTVTALYVIRGAVRGRGTLRAERLVWGMPLGHVHQGMHGLTWGPEGDLYLCTGDPLPRPGSLERLDEWAHWTYFFQPEGAHLPYTGVGAFLRVRPDGSRLRVVARGTRNSCGLAFDSHWNLFSHDNDHEGLPSEFVPGRVLHVTPRAYLGWPRGWMLSKQPDRADLLETMVADMGRGVPVGQAYYDDDYLPARFRENILIARWGTRTLARYPVTAHGATFRAREEPVLIGRNRARPVGVCVGRDGRIFTTIAYMSHNEGSPRYKSDVLMVTRKSQAPEGSDSPESTPFNGYEATEVQEERLWQELDESSWSRQFRAFVELGRRGKASAEALRRLRAHGGSAPPARHWIWLAAADGTHESHGVLSTLAQHKDPGIRVQALRALTEFNSDASSGLFRAALRDPSLRVRHAALLGLFKDGAPPLEDVTQYGACSEDTYVRQAAAFLLAEKAPLNVLRAYGERENEKVRLAGVLAAGFRLTVPPVHQPLAADLPLTPYHGEGAYVVQYADARLDLRKLGRAGTFTFAEHWNRRAHSPEEEELFGLLIGRLEDPDESTRLQAAYFLNLLGDARSNAKVSSTRQAVADSRLLQAPRRRIDSVWLAGPFPDGDEGFEAIHPPERGAVDLDATYPTPSGDVAWREIHRRQHFQGGLYTFETLYGPLARSSVYAYFRIYSRTRQRMLLLPGSDDGLKIWQNGALVWSIDTVRGALPLQDSVPLELEPGGNDILLRVRNAAGTTASLYLHAQSLGGVEVSLPQRLGATSIAQRLGSTGDSPTEVPAEFLAVDWENAIGEGERTRGRALFEALSCSKCHALDVELAAPGAPSLAQAGKRFTVAYLVESILDPSRQVSPIFRATTIVTTDGEIATGLVVAENVEDIELLLADSTRKRIARSHVARRDQLETSSMPQGLVKTPDELKHLLAYILSE